MGQILRIDYLIQHTFQSWNVLFVCRLKLFHMNHMKECDMNFINQ